MMINSSDNEQNKIIVICLMIISFVCVSLALFYTRSILIPFVLALFLRFLIAPIIHYQIYKLRVHRVIAIPVSILIVICFFIIFIPPLYNSIKDFLENITYYQDRLIEFVDYVLRWIQQQFDIELDVKLIENSLTNLPFYEWSSNLLAHMAHFFESMFIILIILLFLIIGESKKEKTATWHKIDRSVKKYISTKFLVAFATAVIFGTTYWILDLELAIIFASLSFFLAFIPIFGAIVSILLPIPSAFIQYDTFTPIILIILIPAVAKIIIGDFIEPKLLGSALDLHPVTIVLALMFWGLLWGLIGVLLAVPLTAIIKISFEQFNSTKSISRILAGNIHHKI